MQFCLELQQVPGSTLPNKVGRGRGGQNSLKVQKLNSGIMVSKRGASGQSNSLFLLERNLISHSLYNFK